MWEDSAGLIDLNGVTLLAGFIVVLMVVMGGYTVMGPGDQPAQSQTVDESASYAVVLTETTIGIENVDARPNVYDQLVIYLDGGGTSQQLPLEEDYAVGDDGDRLFERGEAVRRPLNNSIEPGTPTTVKLVDTGETEILSVSTVNATADTDS